MADHSSRALIGPFAHRLLDVDLPGLTRGQQDEVVDFTLSRVDVMPSVLRLGVHCIAVPMRAFIALPNAGRGIAWLIEHPLPLVGEYVRMIRSLAYTFIWERWPATLPDGTVPASSVPA